ncbi:hypothetical protein Bca52824_034619 [Brassica carinata]|uniref:Replication factor A C-terminal domain-containing protein n=1 Tax=Brassica carinata TaxID=52824 RepID=A0A8X7S1M7_BRACI|nr:hypothetical protein Bca52824_034619 [Brassica carinata]
MFINFSMLHSVGSYRTTKHPYGISFLSTTRVLPSEQLHVDLCGFQPVKYNEVLDGTLNPDYLVDKYIIGHIVKVSHIEHVNVHGKETEKICLELRNSDDERIPLVLWGNVACHVNYAIQVRSEYTTICVLRFGKINIVSNAFNISAIVLDPPMIDVKNFLASLPEDDLPLAIVESKYQAVVNGVSDEDALFRHTPTKTIAEVLETKQVDMCVVLCTVAAIDSDMGWFYLTCKVCSNKVVSVPKYDDDVNEQSCYCLKCKTYNPKTLPRYRLHLVVLDNTSNTKFVVYDNHVIQLLNQPLFHLAGASDKPEGTKDTNSDNMDPQVHSAEMSDSFAMTPAKRIRAFNGDFGERNSQNLATSAFSSVRIKREKLDTSG